MKVLRSKSRAVAGILAAVIMFAMLFTAGLGFVLYDMSLAHNYDIANANNQNLQVSKSQESALAFGTLSGTNTMRVSITNTGGVPFVMTALFVLDSTKTLVCFSPPTSGSTIPACPNYTGILSIPLNVGGQTIVDSGKVLSGCVISASCTSGVLTQRGNIFSASFPTNNGPTITTTLAAQTIAPGTSTYDTAVLNGVTSTAGGTVVYSYFSNGLCGGGGTVVSTVTVTNGIVPNSASQTFLIAGAYSWNAVYSGDANNAGATSSCEPLSVTLGAADSITTTLSATVISAGGSVYDTATLSGATATAGGTVTYHYFNSGTCSGTANTVSTVTVTLGSVPNSASQAFPSVGSYSWNAAYSGDVNNSPATSACEPLSVVSGAGDSIATILSAPVVTAGGSVYDTATLSGVTSTAGGSVTYSYFSAGFCTGAANAVSTVTVTNGVVPNSAAQTFNTVGTYYWHAVYSGDSNNAGATSPCEPLSVGNFGGSTITTILSSVLITPGQSVYDTATLGSVTATAGGTVTYSYFSSLTCSGAGTTVSTVTVTNGVVPNSAARTFASQGTFSWHAVYSGDSNNAGATSPCEPLYVSSTPTCVPSRTNICFSTVTQGLGSIAFDFNSFKWYYYSPSCVPGGTIDNGGSPNANPTSTCSLAPNNVPSGQVAYRISSATWSGHGCSSGGFCIFSANITNADPQQRIITLNSYTQLWFSNFNLKAGGGTAQSWAYGLINMSHANGLPTVPLTTSTAAPSVALNYGQSTTIFFGINRGGNPDQSTSYNISPIFILFSGTITCQVSNSLCTPGTTDFGEDFPLATALWTS